MTWDMPAKLVDYRGRVLVPRDGEIPARLRDRDGTAYPAKFQATEMQTRLEDLAATFPIGAGVYLVEAPEITGTVYPDEPVNVPGTHLGKPTAHCLRADVDWVCVRVDAPLAPLMKWLPASALLPTGRRGR